MAVQVRSSIPSFPAPPKGSTHGPKARLHRAAEALKSIEARPGSDTRAKLREVKEQLRDIRAQTQRIKDPATRAQVAVGLNDLERVQDRLEARQRRTEQSRDTYQPPRGGPGSSGGS